MRKSLSRMRHTVEEKMAGGQQADLRPFVLKGQIIRPSARSVSLRGRLNHGREDNDEWKQ